MSSSLSSRNRTLKTRLISCLSPGEMATGAEAAVLREKVWAEIISVLQGVDPDVTTEF